MPKVGWTPTIGGNMVDAGKYVVGENVTEELDGHALQPDKLIKQRVERMNFLGCLIISDSFF